MNRIKEILKERGISQTWLAKQLDIPVKNLNPYINNKIELKLSTAIKIAKILNVDIKDLLK